MKNSKVRSLLVIFVIYLAAIVLSLYLYKIINLGLSFDKEVLFKIGIVDVIATAFIYITSLIFKNASIYDPYWSVAPIVMSISFYFIMGNSNPWALVLVILICLWGLRLTFNWGYWFRNLNHQDWRYDMFKEKYPKLYPLISFFGIMMFPTLVVYIGMIPAFEFIGNINIGEGFEVTIPTFIAYLVILFAIIIESVADYQKYKYKKIPANQGLVLEWGLWKNSRHPNYFGECLFWFGIFLASFSYTNSKPLLVFCPLVVFLMFEFISIPMMDKRQLETKPAFKEYKERTNPMLPILPPKKK